MHSLPGSLGTVASAARQRGREGGKKALCRLRTLPYHFISFHFPERKVLSLCNLVTPVCTALGGLSVSIVTGLTSACSCPPILLQLPPSAQPITDSQILTAWTIKHVWKLTPCPDHWDPKSWTTLLQPVDGAGERAGSALSTIESAKAVFSFTTGFLLP